MITRVLRIDMEGGEGTLHASGIDQHVVTVGKDEVGPSGDMDSSTLSAVLASRLAMSLDDPKVKNIPMTERRAVSYLAGVYDRATREIGLEGESKNKDELCRSILADVKDLSVSYCVSGLTVPDLFESAEGAIGQLFACLADNVHNVASGGARSFLHAVLGELAKQEELDPVVDALLEEARGSVKAQSVLDPAFPSAIGSCRALTALFSHKPSAIIATRSPVFLLPPASDSSANTIVQPDLGGFDAAQQNFMRMMMSMQARNGNGRGNMPPGSYKKRSGPALEKTLLGLLVSVGLPLRDVAFKSQFQNAARRTIVDISNVRSSLRKQNKSMRDAADAIIMQLLKAGAVSRSNVLTWLADALLVNISATVSHQYR